MSKPICQNCYYGEFSAGYTRTTGDAEFRPCVTEEKSAAKSIFDARCVDEIISPTEDQTAADAITPALEALRRMCMSCATCVLWETHGDDALKHIQGGISYRCGSLNRLTRSDFFSANYTKRKVDDNDLKS